MRSAGSLPVHAASETVTPQDVLEGIVLLWRVWEPLEAEQLDTPKTREVAAWRACRRVPVTATYTRDGS
jgi:hypothetical protein